VVIRGQKIWTSYAHLATWGILLARTRVTGRPKTALATSSSDGRTGRDHRADRRYDRRTTRFNEVFLDDVRLGDEYLLGEVNDGWRLAKVTLGNERIALSGEGVLWGRGPTASDLVALVRTRAANSRAANAMTSSVLVARRDS